MPTNPTPITALPSSPDRNDRATFSARATASFDALKNAFVPEANALATVTYNNAVEAAAAATTATTKAAEADISADAAAASALAALNAPGTSATSTSTLTIGTGSKSLTIQTGKSLVAGANVILAMTSDPTKRMSGVVTSYNSGTGDLVASIDTAIGSGSASDWSVALGAATGQGASQAEMETGTEASIRAMSPLRVAQAIAALGKGKVLYTGRTSNTEIGAADFGKLIDITSGTFTQTFSACATLGDGWWCYIRNSGSGDITLDPSASETIDGLSSFIMYPQETRMIQCNGSVLRSIVLNSFYKVFETSGTFTKPPGYAAYQGLLWGGGGSGARNTNGNACGGGGAAAVPFNLLFNSVSSSETITIGAGGTGVTTNASGNAGGTSSLGSLVYAYGGGGGFGASSSVISGGGGGGALSAGAVGSSTSAAGGLPGPSGGSIDGTNYINQGFGGGASNNSVAAGGASIYGGGAGQPVTAATTNVSTNSGGKSLYGGGGGGAACNDGTNRQGSGGISSFGGSGGDGNASASASNGSSPGGGGGATVSGTTSGAGARGELRIWGVI